MLRSITVTIFSLFATTCFAQENSVDVLNLQKVIVEFEESIKTKDSTRFHKLFFEDDVLFTGIMSKSTEMSIKKDYPEFQGIAVSNQKRFIKQICETEKKQAEKFYNISVDTDNTIASISFDYGFYSDEKLFQWGHEKWNLVKVENEWLITDVVFSIHFPDIEPFPFE